MPLFYPELAASKMLDMEVDVLMAPSRHHLPLTVASALALFALTALMVSLSPAGAEDVAIYEFSELSTDHPAMAVAVRSDGGEAVVLCSEQNTSTSLWSNWVFTTSGTTLIERGSWTGQNWYWMSAAFRPGGSEALLGGSRGTLYSYKNSALTVINTGLSYDMLEIVWHPTSGTAYIGTNTNRIYQYRSSSISLWENVNNWCTGLDIRPDGGELIVSTYNGMQVYNFTLSIWTTLAKPPTDDGDEYYYSHSVRYSPDGSYILASWRSWDSSGLFRYTTTWNLIQVTSSQVNRMEFEDEGTFALLAMPSNLQYAQGGAVSTVADWFSTGSRIPNDMDYNGKDFYFLVGTDVGVFKFQRKPNVMPWLGRYIPDLFFDEDDPEGGNDLIDLYNYIQDDRFQEKLRFEWDFQQDTDLLEGTIDGNYLDFEQKVSNWHGKMSFRIKVWDMGFDDIEGNFDDVFNRTNMFNVTVRSINDPVSLISVGDREVGLDEMVFFIDEGDWLNLSLVTLDVDDDPLGTQSPKFSFNKSLPTLKVNYEIMELTFNPRNKDVGTQYINITVTDDHGSFFYVDIVIHVRNINNPPKLQGIRDKQVDEDSWLNFTVWARDEDLEIGKPDIITFSTNRTDGVDDDDLPNFSFMVDQDEPTRIHVSFLPTNIDVGEVPIEFRVRDGSAPFGTWQDRRSMVITVINTNDAPVLVEANGINLEALPEYALVATEDEELSITLLAQDDDWDRLVYYVDDSRVDLSQPGGGYTAELTFTPTNDEVGLIFVTISVWDTFNTFDELVVNITVVNVNDPPFIEAFEARDTIDVDELTFTVYEDVLFSAPIIVVDIDSISMEFDDSQDILLITVDPQNPMRAVAEYTPTQTDIGEIITTLEVRDGDGGLDALNIVFTVVGTNDDPGATEVTHQGGEVSLTARLSATAVTDPDGDTDLTYKWDFGDHSAPVSGVDLTLVEHTYAQDGTYVVTVTVSDGNGGSSTVHAEVIVLPPEDIPEDTEVEKGPVLLIGALLVALAVMAAVLLYLYWKLPGREQV